MGVTAGVAAGVGGGLVLDYYVGPTLYDPIIDGPATDFWMWWNDYLDFDQPNTGGGGPPITSPPVPDDLPLEYDDIELDPWPVTIGDALDPPPIEIDETKIGPPWLDPGPPDVRLDDPPPDSDPDSSPKPPIRDDDDNPLVGPNRADDLAGALDIDEYEEYGDPREWTYVGPAPGDGDPVTNTALDPNSRRGYDTYRTPDGDIIDIHTFIDPFGNRTGHKGKYPDWR